MDFKTISAIIDIFNNCREVVELEKIKFVGDCHGDLFQFLMPLAKIISVKCTKTIDKYNIIDINVDVSILKNFSTPVVYYLGDLFSTNQGSYNEADYVIEKIIFQILRSSRLVKWIIGNHDMEKFSAEYVEKYRILNLVDEGKILLCDHFKSRLLSHTCFSASVVKLFSKLCNAPIPYVVTSTANLVALINFVFKDLLSSNSFETLLESDILWNRIQNNCYKSIVGHTPGLRHYIHEFNKDDKQLYVSVKHTRLRSHSVGELELLSFNELDSLKVIDISKNNTNIQIPTNVITECSTYKGRCKQIFKNIDIRSTEDETDNKNKDNLRNVAVIDFGCSYDKNDSPYGYIGISIPDFLYYDSYGIYELTNLPVYAYIYTTDGIKIHELNKLEAFDRIKNAHVINYTHINDDNTAYIVKKRYCDASVYVYKFLDEFEDRNYLLECISRFMIMSVLVATIVKVIMNIDDESEKITKKKS